jgi:putative radical SAM enzyme (TIGR03279 family)
MKIAKTRPGSISDNWKLPNGSILISINGQRIRDSLDYMFYSSDDELEFVIEFPDGNNKSFSVERNYDQDIGLEFAPDKIRCCGNKCIFCFIDQLPKGLRKNLYLKDEDYRLSFLDGNFVTLTSVTERDLKRIKNFRLSPLYVSVHTTDETMRKAMLGRKRLKPVMDVLTFLVKSEIEVHTQIVLCPGYNDGIELNKTINDLASLRPNLLTVGIVPVGLNKHRKSLPQLNAVQKGEAMRIIEDWGPSAQKKFRKDGNGFVYLADEFYLLASAEIPDRKYYDDYPQFENGIGMARSFLDDFDDHKNQSRDNFQERNLKITLITGKLMAPILTKHVVPELGKMFNKIQFKLLPVANRLLGESITVSGLLSGIDIIDAYKTNHIESDLIILPPNCTNSEGLLLDDTTPDTISEKLNTDVVVGSYDIVESIIKLLEGS